MRLKKTTSIILICLFLSIVIHLTFVFLIARLRLPDREVPADKQKVVFVEMPKARNLPIVDIAKPKIQELPDKPSAEALYSQKVAEQQVSPRSGPSSAPQKKGSPGTQAQKQREAKSAKEPPAKKAPSLEPQDSKHQKQSPFEDPPKKEAPELPELPTQPKIPGMPESAPSRLGGEYLPKIKIGDTTYINTQANMNVAYFVEIKRRYSLTWNPARILRPQMGRLPKGTIQVMMGVTVNASGQLARVLVLKKSGVEGYDEEALRTVQSSAPYSAPPASLLENGVLNMAWTFIVHR